jgi:4-amino-4-deoxy-L-arabinose transferase-like glycosyltransferase
MSPLLSRVMLAMMMFPLAAMVYVITVVSAHEVLGYQRVDWEWVLAGIVTSAFVAGYWWMLWRAGVAWTPQRRARTWGAAGGAVVAGVVLGSACAAADDEFGLFVGTSLPPLLWVAATCFVWRSDARDVAGTAAAGDGDDVVCPACAYSLKGLREARCPECGEQWTLDQLFAAQPRRAARELER